MNACEIQLLNISHQHNITDYRCEHFTYRLLLQNYEGANFNQTRRKAFGEGKFQFV